MARLVTSYEGDEGRLPVHPVRVLRLDPGQEFFVRTLGATIGGVNTHRVKGFSEYCLGPKSCPPIMHGTKVFWKGYFACDVWMPEKKLYRPHVCEFTESAELDIRGFYCRGLMLRVWKRPAKAREKPPLQVEIIELLEEEQVPGEFDIVPVLRIMYHVQEIRLDVKNHCPDRVVLEDASGAPPKTDKEGYVQLERPITRAEMQAKFEKAGIKVGKSKPDERKVV